MSNLMPSDIKDEGDQGHTLIIVPKIQQSTCTGFYR